MGTQNIHLKVIVRNKYIQQYSSPERKTRNIKILITTVELQSLEHLWDHEN